MISKGNFLGEHKHFEMRALPLSSSQQICPPSVRVAQCISTHGSSKSYTFRGVWAKSEAEKEPEEKKEKKKQSLFSSVTEALDFSQVRSAEDAQLIEDARETTGSGGRMNKEQYGALRRKIGGTYKDFFKSYVDGKFLKEIANCQIVNGFFCFTC
ncbi:hypothetical protein IFM89_033538 [Coptis chinensis]|uniref:GATA-type transcription activator N-terminal domain-containing protein n=1 Tax=Coptis chinensis TaxID=261450 RepID=A0A835HCX1_9MAGN|nr:hypothetical protein IFM89_033538 [Coptis chinensis]